MSIEQRKQSLLSLYIAIAAYHDARAVLNANSSYWDHRTDLRECEIAFLTEQGVIDKYWAGLGPLPEPGERHKPTLRLRTEPLDRAECARRSAVLKQEITDITTSFTVKSRDGVFVTLNDSHLPKLEWGHRLKPAAEAVVNLIADGHVRMMMLSRLGIVQMLC